MSDDKFDAIVVGAGVAGSVAALVMARAGLDVLVIERGDSAGCKNMTGGRLYAHTLEAIIPGFAASAPIERKVTREKISFLTEESAVTLDFHREQPDVPQHACVVAMPDERLGERSCAYVVLKAPHHSLSLEEVVAFFSRKRVAKYKYPEHIVVIEKLPRTVSGKIQ
ncbi:FAD-dependent oxidoreductase [Escherichia coli]